jgi:hypothetical protein
MPSYRSRPLLAALLWLLVALLPLRSLAMDWMQVSMAAMSPPAAVEKEALPPCHAAVLEEALTDNTAADNAAESHVTCTLCDLCHSGVVPAPTYVAPIAPPHGSSPAAIVSAGHEGPRPDGLFRPPR